MHVSRGIFNIEMAVRKLSSRFRRPMQVSRAEWPVISATRPLFYFIRIFGVAPYEISDGRLIPTSCSAIYSLFCILVHTYFAYLVLERFASIKRGSVILDITETGKVVFNYSVVLLNIVVAIWTRKEFIGVLNVVKNFDIRIRELGFPRTEVSTKIWVWSSGIYTAFCWTMISSMGMIAFDEPWCNNMEYLINYLATSITIIKFSSLVLLLGQRFRHLNNVAQRSKESITIKQKYIAIEYKVIHQLHNSLMNASENLNSQYSWPLLLWLINLCVHSVSNVYFLINWFTVTQIDWADNQWAFVICMTSWLVAFVGQLLLLHIACHFTSTEANNIGSILVNWKSLAIGGKYRVDSSLHLIHRRLNFSAAGCFYVNLPLLRSITAILTTYLVLLMQFQN